MIPVALDRDGNFDVPADISRIGWFSPGVTPGSAQGSAVMAAHRDAKGGKKGVFYALGNAQVGDSVSMLDQDGTRHDFRVTAVNLLPKKDFAPAASDLFSPTSSARIVLISCGGQYLPLKGGYQANVIVIAEPVR